MRNVIHSRHPASSDSTEGLYLDSIDRGPKGEQGEQGKQGKPGEQGKTGIGVTAVYVDDNDHLITEMSDGSKTDAGEMPKVISRRIFTCQIDGTTNEVPINTPIKTDRVTHILINGVTYTEGFSFNGTNLVLGFSAGEIPAGKLEIFASTHSRAGEIEVPLDLQPITDEELEVILSREEA